MSNAILPPVLELDSPEALSEAPPVLELDSPEALSEAQTRPPVVEESTTSTLHTRADQWLLAAMLIACGLFMVMLVVFMLNPALDSVATVSSSVPTGP